MWFKMGMAQSKPSPQSDSACRRVFLQIFFSELRPHRIAAIYRECRGLKRRSPVLPFVWLLATLVFHALMGRGALEQHAQEMTGKKISGSALSQRRQRLPWEIFRRIMEVGLVARAEERKHPQAFYQGLRLVGLDGTCFGLQNVPRIVRALGKATTRRFKEAFARVRVVLLVELGLHNPIGAIIGQNQESEMALAWDLLAKLPVASLLLADRLYGVPSFVGVLLARCLELKSQFLVRVRKNLKARVLEVLADGSAIMELQIRDEDGEKFSFLVREIRGRVQRRSGGWTPVRLWTSLLDARHHPASRLLTLYAQRWEVEITIKELKIEMRGSDRLASYTVETAAQEIAALLLAQAVLVNHRTHAAQQGGTDVLRISFAQAQRFLRAMWWALDSTAAFLSPDQAVAMIQNGLKKLGAIYVSAPRRKRSCPREVRQPIGKWPRKTRNCSWTAEITHEIIPFKA